MSAEAEVPEILAEIKQNVPYVLAAVMRYSGVLAIGVTLGVLLSGDIAYQACVSVPMPTDNCTGAMRTLASIEKTGAIAGGVLLVGGAILNSQTTITEVDDD